MKKFLSIITMFFAVAIAGAQTLTNASFCADSTCSAKISGTYFVKPNADSSVYTIKTSIGITSSPRTYAAAGKNANNGLKPTPLTDALFQIKGIEKVELGLSAVKIFLADGTTWNDVEGDIIDNMISYAWYSPSKGRTPDGMPNHQP